MASMPIETISYMCSSVVAPAAGAMFPMLVAVVKALYNMSEYKAPHLNPILNFKAFSWYL